MMQDGDEVGSGHPLAPPRWAMATFLVLFAMNLLDYVDRNILMTLRDEVRKDIACDNFQWGALTSIFLVSYSVFSPLMGWLGDRYRRTRLLAIGVAIWSLATVGSGLARSYGH